MCARFCGSAAPRYCSLIRDANGISLPIRNPMPPAIAYCTRWKWLSKNPNAAYIATGAKPPKSARMSSTPTKAMIGRPARTYCCAKLPSPMHASIRPIVMENCSTLLPRT